MAAVGEVLAWWVVLVGIWLSTLSSPNSQELGVAVASSLVCALAAVPVRRALPAKWRPQLGWVRWLLPLPAAVLADMVRLFGLALAPRRALPGGGESKDGELSEIHLPQDDDPHRAGIRRALASLAVSATPGTYVVDSRSEDNVLIVHSLGSGTPSMDEVVSR